MSDCDVQKMQDIMDQPYQQKVEYDDKITCVKCGGYNEIRITDTLNDGSIISECETKCAKCLHEDYWGYGFFESKGNQEKSVNDHIKHPLKPTTITP